MPHLVYNRIVQRRQLSLTLNSNLSVFTTPISPLSNFASLLLSKGQNLLCWIVALYSSLSCQPNILCFLILNLRIMNRENLIALKI